MKKQKIRRTKQKIWRIRIRKTYIKIKKRKLKENQKNGNRKSKPETQKFERKSRKIRCWQIVKSYNRSVPPSGCEQRQDVNHQNNCPKISPHKNQNKKSLEFLGILIHILQISFSSCVTCGTTHIQQQLATLSRETGLIFQHHIQVVYLINQLGGKRESQAIYD